MDAKFLTSASKPEQLPDPITPEMAFVGRSNCGKSSLINAICQRQNLARTSQTPGRTQLANFFLLNDQVTLIDLPGYGFSATGKSHRAHWQELAEASLRRPSVQQILFLLDARRKPNAEDRELAKFLADCAALTVILTKADKAKQAEIQRHRSFIQADFASSGITVQRVLAVSSTKKRGIEELQELALGLTTP